VLFFLCIVNLRGGRVMNIGLCNLFVLRVLCHKVQSRTLGFS
jgi:hypothetical protein